MIDREWKKLIKEHWYTLFDVIKWTAIQQAKDGLIYDIYLTKNNEILVIENENGNVIPKEAKTGDALFITSIYPDSGLFDTDLDEIRGQKLLDILSQYGLKYYYIQDFQTWIENNGYDEPTLDLLQEYDPIIYGGVFDYIVTQLTDEEEIEEVLNTAVNKLTEAKQLLPTDIEKGSLKKVLGYADSTNLADVQTDEMIKRAKSQINSGKISYQELIRKLNWQAVMNKTNAPEFSKKLNQVMDALQDWYEKSK